MPLQLVSFGLVALGAPLVVLTRDPLRQSLVNGVYGVSLVFHGWGDREDELLGETAEEDPLERNVLRPLLVAVALVAVAAGVAVSVVPDLGQRAKYAADRFRDTSGYAATVLHGKAMAPPPSLPVSIEHTSTESILYGVSARRSLRLRSPSSASIGAAYRARCRSPLAGRSVRWFASSTHSTAASSATT